MIKDTNSRAHRNEVTRTDSRDPFDDAACVLGSSAHEARCLGPGNISLHSNFSFASLTSEDYYNHALSILGTEKPSRES